MRTEDVDPAILAELVDRIFAPLGAWTIERTSEGGSTPVYRLRRRGEVLYLRLAESREASLAPEALVHRLLHARGVRVPAVLYFEPFNARLERSVMVTTAIAGEALAHCRVAAATPAILRAAGRDLAQINSLPVHGFGWILRHDDAASHLAAVQPTNRRFLLEHYEDDLALLACGVLSDAELAFIHDLAARYAPWLEAERAWLAHGDLDLTHIYQQDGRYSGIIDFGEIRGTDRLYDLGHFNLHDGERVAELLLPALLAGYNEVVPPTPDQWPRICFNSVLIGVRALARGLQRHPPGAYERYLISAIRRALQPLR